jgi:SAM-dependent methyltransferase
MDAEVGREPQYDVFADEFLGHAQGGFYNAYYDRPACLALLGDVTGKRVLDAACGPGLYAAELIGRGAQVVGFDHSPRMVEICRARVSQASSACATWAIGSAGWPMTVSTWPCARWRSNTWMTG